MTSTRFASSPNCALVAALFVLSIGTEVHSQDPYTLPNDIEVPLPPSQRISLPNNTRVTINGKEHLLPDTRSEPEKVTRRGSSPYAAAGTRVQTPAGHVAKDEVKFNDDTTITLPQGTIVKISYRAPGATQSHPLIATLSEDTHVTPWPALTVDLLQVLRPPPKPTTPERPHTTPRRKPQGRARG